MLRTELCNRVNIFALCLPPRSKLSTSSIADEPRRGITANKRFALRGLMNRKKQLEASFGERTQLPFKTDPSPPSHPELVYQTYDLEHKADTGAKIGPVE